MMKKLFCLFALIACALPLVSCGEEGKGGDDPVVTDVSVSLSCNEIKAWAPGGKIVVGVETNAKEWTAYGSDGADWFTVAANAADKSIEVMVKPNSGDKREATVTFKSGQTRKSIPLVQAAPLSVDKASLYFSKEGGKESVGVNFEGEWKAECVDNTVDWISCAKSGGQLSFVAQENAAAPRETKFKVSNDVGEAVEIEVKQGGDEAFICPLDGYHLVWHDEFEQEGIDLDRSNWTHEVKGDHWVNHELQNYVNTKSPKGERVTEVTEGTLKIHCFKEGSKIYSGRVYACQKTGWQYGYVEARIKLPSGKGTWPAFWMMPVNFKSWPADGEIDIMEEVGYHKDYVSSSLHATGHVHSNGTQVTKEVYCKGAEGEFHLYGMEWTKDYFQFYVDGKKTLYYKNPGTGKVDWPYDAPFYVILNLAWGGDWGGSQGVDEKALPVTLEVDYVRVFQK